MPRKTSKTQTKKPQKRPAKKHTLTSSSSPDPVICDGDRQDVLLFMSNIEGDLREFLDGKPLLGDGLAEKLQDLSTKAGQLPGAFVKPQTVTTITSDELTLDWKAREDTIVTADDIVDFRTTKDSREDDQNDGKERADQRKQHRMEKTVDHVVGSPVTIARENFQSLEVSTSNSNQQNVQRNKGEVENACIERSNVTVKTEKNSFTNTSRERQSIGSSVDEPPNKKESTVSELGRSKRERRPSVRCITCFSCNSCVPARRRHKSAPVRKMTSKTGATLHNGLDPREESFVTTHMIDSGCQGNFFCRDCLTEFGSFSGFSLHVFGNCQPGRAGKDNKVSTPRIMFTDEVTVL
uniref:Uncharacterized protein n=1 Tax=Branchiostoma floridae TaxID=7739 RepID=C3YJF2_BRAFL|eukprot:XP_002603540.1 hypothetical protein BRAFLDRAFT_79075 [Branchiostoma floridae]